MADEVVGFTDKQRKYFHTVYANQCAFHTKVNGYWTRCTNTSRLEVHHIIPRGWARMNMPHSFEVNGVENGITLCKHHHEMVHPDVPVARELHRNGNKAAFAEMMATRKELNEQGVPYWNTQWDLMFLRLNKRFVSKFNERVHNPYPRHKIRGLNGRVPALA